ncbi:hypothetical protein KGA66_17300 [Actinocrinis puniceicyclus]|uniref:GTP cyclohydrolase II domain-containing protein n=1 Tax=Actinocrinis puniceicyclus TaxID=977794 RepID=A0A8J7WRS1_9ACTN|nr:hypothetical protein [Actinocrinis puniceicyclus]
MPNSTPRRARWNSRAGAIRPGRRDEGSPVTRLLAGCALPTRFGDFDLHVYGDGDGREKVLAAIHRAGEGCGAEPPLVGVHSVCLTGDVLGSRKCDCGPQLDAALAMIAADRADRPGTRPRVGHTRRGARDHRPDADQPARHRHRPLTPVEPGRRLRGTRPARLVAQLPAAGRRAPGSLLGTNGLRDRLRHREPHRADRGGLHQGADHRREISGSMLEAARAKGMGERVSFTRGDFLDLPVCDVGMFVHLPLHYVAADMRCCQAVRVSTGVW